MKKFLIDMAERALKTAAQTAIATIGTSACMSDVNWIFVGSCVLLATILSICTSLASRPIGDKDSASLVNKEDK